MPTSPLESAGAAIQPTAAAPLHVNEFFTGLWTNGNPLGPGPVPYLYQKFYSASRFDRLIDGADVEISPRLTLIRRPGHTVYNPGPFPPINRFYEFRGFTATDEIIHLIADCDPGTGSSSGTVREVTQPSTNLILWTKTAGAGRTSFVSNGNILYAGDGAATHKFVTSGQVWTANTLYQTGSFIIDPNGNIQWSVGSQTANLTYIQVAVTSHSAGSPPTVTYYYAVDIFLSAATPLNIKNNVKLTLSGLTTVPWVNGTNPFSPKSETQAHAVISSGFTPPNPAVPYSPETGTATTGTGISGSSAPAWSASAGGVTQDGGNQWVNLGPASQNWGIAAPTIAPTVTQAPAPTASPLWQANTWYAPAGAFIIIDSNNNIQQLTTAGTTKSGSGAPAWATTPGATTPDGTCVWTCIGSGTWAPSTNYAVGNMVVVTFTYYITDTTYDYNRDIYVTESIPNTVTSVFQCTASGVTGATQPAWTNGIGTVTQDGSVQWTNAGPPQGWPGLTGGASQVLSLVSTVLDPLGNFEAAQTLGETGLTAPTWATTQGALTTDKTVSWLNQGPYSAANTGAWVWAYSGKNSVTGEISTASPLSQPVVVGSGNLAVVQGPGLADPQVDTIVLWRTTQGGSTLMYDDEFPNPGAGKTWIYTETNQDPSSTRTDSNGNPVYLGSAQPGELNFLITAPIAHSNDPPPATFVPKAYYLGRIWGYVNNLLRWSGGPDIVTGNGDSAFPPINQFRFTSKGVLCWPTSVGLLCFTSTDIWAVLGQGTTNSPFYVVNFQAGIGMASQDAFGVNGSTAYAMLTSHQVVSMDPGAGELEVGFPVADIFDTYYDPSTVYITWHQGRSADTALYVADGTDSWFRMAAVSAPESGNVWSPAASIHSPGKVRAMTSAEIAPGQKILILGPGVDGNPILKRDFSVHSDNGVAYAAHATIAPIVLSQPGSTAGVQFAVTEEKLINSSSPLAVKMLFDEIHDGVHVGDGDWRALRNRSNDPPNLPRQKSVLAQRLWAQQDPSTVIRCRFYEQDISWLAEDYPNELYTNTVYGRLPEKARK